MKKQKVVLEIEYDETQYPEPINEYEWRDLVTDADAYELKVTSIEVTNLPNQPPHGELVAPDLPWADHAGHQIMYSQDGRTDYIVKSLWNGGVDISAWDIERVDTGEIINDEFWCHDCGKGLPWPQVEDLPAPTLRGRINVLLDELGETQGNDEEIDELRSLVAALVAAVEGDTESINSLLEEHNR